MDSHTTVPHVGGELHGSYHYEEILTKSLEVNLQTICMDVDQFEGPSNSHHLRHCIRGTEFRSMSSIPDRIHHSINTYVHVINWISLLVVLIGTRYTILTIVHGHYSWHQSTVEQITEAQT